MRLEWLTLIVVLVISVGLDCAVAVSADRQLHHQYQQQQQQFQQQQPQQQQQKQQRNDGSTTDDSPWSSPEFMVVRRVYDDCLNTNDFIGCLKQRALQALSRALEQDTIKIVDGLVLEKQNQTEAQGIVKSLTDARTLNTLAPIDRALLAKVDKLVRTHAVKFDMDEGRGQSNKKHKKKKHKDGGHIKYVIAAMLTAMGIAGPIGLKALAAIAIKALVISKVALTIAGIIALKKLFSHDHHEETSFQVHAGDHNRRSTYVIRPLAKPSVGPSAAGGALGVGSAGIAGAGGAGGGASGAAGSNSVDPYRYYYEYHS